MDGWFERGVGKGGNRGSRDVWLRFEVHYTMLDKTSAVHDTLRSWWKDLHGSISTGLGI